MKQYIVDAFTDKVFGGNQAAVCVLDEWISDSLMQNIAKENNFSETAFTVKEGEKYHLRWFTPAAEIDFCGHALQQNRSDGQNRRSARRTSKGSLH